MDVDNMNEEKYIREEIDELAKGFPKQMKPEPPSGYFEELPGQMIRRWQQEQNDIKVRRLSRLRFFTAAAVMTGLVIGIGWWMSGAGPVKELQAMTEADAYQYIMENIEEFDVMLEQETTWSDPSELQLPSPDQVEKYLMEEVNDDLMEELF
jgi:hypothetical protein